MSNKLYTLVSFILFSVSVFGQTLSGNLYLHANQDISLTTFKAYDAVAVVSRYDAVLAYEALSEDPLKYDAVKA